MHGRYLVYFSSGQVVATALTILANKDLDEASRTASTNLVIAQRGSNITQTPGRVELAPLSKQQEGINSILLRELVSTEPRLIAAPNLAAVAHAESDDQSQSGNETLIDTTTNRRKKNLSHRKSQNTDPRR